MIIQQPDKEMQAVVDKALRSPGNDVESIETSFLHYLYNTFGRQLQSSGYYSF